MEGKAFAVSNKMNKSLDKVKTNQQNFVFCFRQNKPCCKRQQIKNKRNNVLERATLFSAKGNAGVVQTLESF